MRLAPETDVDMAWSLLEEMGLSPLFTSETADGIAEMVLDCPLEHLPDSLAFVQHALHYQGAQETDWEAQWQMHGHNYHDGFVHVPVHTSTLKLMPGPGFGDLSHPTTNLALELLLPHIQHQIVLDIGSGSGILTLAAAQAGATRACGVDINPQAVEHARTNATLNDLQDTSVFDEYLSVIPDVIVINMIWSEQQLAWQTWDAEARQAHTIIVSGLLADERDGYLAYAQQWPWHLVEEKQCGEWLAFRFYGHGRNRHNEVIAEVHFGANPTSKSSNSASKAISAITSNGH